MAPPPIENPISCGFIIISTKLIVLLRYPRTLPIDFQLNVLGLLVYLKSLHPANAISDLVYNV